MPHPVRRRDMIFETHSSDVRKENGQQKKWKKERARFGTFLMKTSQDGSHFGDPKGDSKAFLAIDALNFSINFLMTGESFGRN